MSEFLHQYQRDAVQWMLDTPKGAFIAGMGLGKTLVTLTALQSLLDDWEVGKVLVVAPKRVALTTWPDEIWKWPHLNLPYAQLCGEREHREAAVQSSARLHIINIDNLVWLIDHLGKKWDYDMVVIDESSLFKSPSTRRFKALKRRLSDIDRVVLLTGTPAPNGLLDLWPQVYLLDGGQRLFRTITAYKQHYFESDYLGYKWTPRSGSEEDIYQRISDLCLRLDTADYTDVPERIDVRVPVTLPPKALQQYRTLEREHLLQLERDDVTAASAGVLVGKLLQMANGAVYAGDGWEELHSAKVEALKDIIETAQGQPVLVAYYFKHDLARLRDAIPNAQVLDANPDTIAAWNAGEIPVLLAHPQCLHPDTEVLTEHRGWQRIVAVSPRDRVFDGEQYVSHSGCALSGFRPVVDMLGVKATEDHLFLINGEWRTAKYVRDSGISREEARYAFEGDAFGPGSLPPLRLGLGDHEAKRRPGKPNWAGRLRGLCPKNPREVEQPDIRNLARHALQGEQPSRPGLLAVRGPWPRGLRLLGEVRRLLQGHGGRLRSGVDSGEGRQLPGVLQRQLPLGNTNGAAGQQVQQQDPGLHERTHAPSRVLPQAWGGAGRDLPQVESRHDAGAGPGGLQGVEVPQEPEVSPVYDLVDCGPRNRFVVRNREGDVFIAHNSAGHGLNLQHGGSILTWFGLVWSLELYQQFNARLDRQGQKNAVVVHHLIAQGTVDDDVMSALATKDATQQSLLDALKRRRG